MRGWGAAEIVDEDVDECDYNNDRNTEYNEDNVNNEDVENIDIINCECDCECS